MSPAERALFLNAIGVLASSAVVALAALRGDLVLALLGALTGAWHCTMIQRLGRRP